MDHRKIFYGNGSESTFPLRFFLIIASTFHAKCVCVSFQPEKSCSLLQRVVVCSSKYAVREVTREHMEGCTIFMPGKIIQMLRNI